VEAPKPVQYGGATTDCHPAQHIYLKEVEIWKELLSKGTAPEKNMKVYNLRISNQRGVLNVLTKLKGNPLLSTIRKKIEL
jgi:hypothetical protein